MGANGTAKPRRAPLLWPLLGAALGAALFAALYGVRVLDPTSVDWLLNAGSDDPAQHYLGWALYRSSSIRLPYLGLSYATVYPYRTSILFSDSLPLAALLLRPFSALLPVPFQYLGLWGLLCFCLQGALGQRLTARIAGAAPDDAAAQGAALLGAGVLLLFPALLVRMFGHTALAGTWLILLALLLWLNADAWLPATRRAVLAWGGMGLLCAGVHLYYLPMVGLALLAFAVRRALQRRGWAAALLPVAAFCGAALAEIFVLGAFAGNFSGYSNGFLSGADLLGLLVPGLAASWEQDVFIGWGAVLALALAAAGAVRARRRGRLLRGPGARGWLVSGAVLLVPDLAAAAGSTVTAGGRVLFTLPLPQFVLNAWSMFSSCARLAWLAGLLLAGLGCGLVVRFWGARAGAALLALCVGVQAWSVRDKLADRYADFHDPARYENQTLLTDPAWQTLADSGLIEHLAFATFDYDHAEFWDLAALAADCGWTCNCFYLAHMDDALAAATLPGELNDPQPATLYVFLDEDALARNNFDLHYYTLDGILLGSVNELPLAEAAPDAAPAHDEDLAAASLNDAAVPSGGTVTLGAGGELSTADWTLFPGVYTVTLRGEGFDHSYIYTDAGARNRPRTQQELTFTAIAPDEMTFTFTTGEVLTGWRVSVHALDETPVTIESITVTKTG